MDLGIFQETKCTDEIYTCESARYRVVATDAPIRHRDGVALLYIPSPLIAVEAVREYRLNVMIFEVPTGARRWFIIGCYLAPDDTSTIESVPAELKEQPWSTELMAAGDFNVKPSDPEGGVNHGSANFRRVREYVGPLPPTMLLMVPGREDVEHGPGGEGDEVPDGLYPGDESLSLLECVHPGPQA